MTSKVLREKLKQMRKSLVKLEKVLDTAADTARDSRVKASTAQGELLNAKELIRLIKEELDEKI